jgi:hypothetical protein
MTPLPQYPWQRVSIDFLGPFNTGDYAMVLSDNYSRFPVVEIIRSTATTTVVPRLDKIFAEFGIPQTLMSDNGPPFNGQPFADFATRLGFRHRKITPLHPMANGEAERFMRTLGKAIRTAQMNINTPWQREIHTFLRNYRSTQHSTTGECPATLMFQRTMRVKLPSIETTEHPSRAAIANRNDLAKSKMKQYADNRRKAHPTRIAIGDTVIVRQTRRTKMDATYNPTPYVVHKINGSMITARRDNHLITRNAAMFKVITKQHVPTDISPEITLERLRQRVHAPRLVPPLVRALPERTHVPIATPQNPDIMPSTPMYNSPNVSTPQPTTTDVPTQTNRYPQRVRSPPKRYGAWATLITTHRPIIPQQFTVNAR